MLLAYYRYLEDYNKSIDNIGSMPAMQYISMIWLVWIPR